MADPSSSPGPAGGASVFARARTWLVSVRLRPRQGKELAARAGIALLFVVLLLAHTRLLRPVLQNGDSAVYNQQIETGDFSNRTTHIGYIALGSLFNRLPFGTDLNMNVMVLTVGVLGLAALYASARSLSGSRWAALASALLALGVPSQLRGMLLSEVDVVSASTIAISYACFLRGAPLIAGVVFGFSVLVTPISGPMLVVFLLTVSVSEHGLKASALRHTVKMAKWGAAAALVYLPIVWAHYDDYVHGGRGLLHASRAAYAWPERLARSWGFLGREGGLILPLCLVGALACLASVRIWRIGQPALALLVSVLVMSLAAERFADVPVQLPNLLLLTLLPAVALVVSPWASRVGAPLVLAVGFFTLRGNYARISAEIEGRERDRRLCVGIREQSRPRVPVLVGVSGWTPQRMFERYASADSRSPPVFDARQFARKVGWLAASDGYQVWFIRRVPQHQLAPLLRKYSLETRTVEARALQVLVPK